MAVLLSITANVNVNVVKLVGLQPDKSVLHKYIGRDFTGKAQQLAKEDAEKEGLLKDFKVR